ncbi:MAG: xanthine dehydrogenase accessory protein XdhC [Cognatishimia sp.]
MFDLEQLQVLLTKHPAIARVVTIELRGSGPREVGSSLYVWPGGQSGSIGGGTLEYEATKAALKALQSPRSDSQNPYVGQCSSHPLGPALGQCCGGAVRLVTEVFTLQSLKAIQSQTQGLKYYLRAVRPAHGVLSVAKATSAPQVPLALQRALATHRAQGAEIKTLYQDGWLLEPLTSQRKPLWIWGAGHVGRALVHTLALLPDFELTWVDTNPARFPTQRPPNVTILPAASPAALVAHAPQNAHHLLVTYSHALDLELCDQLLRHSFDFAGLIGSKTKWVRFQKRLQDLGHSPAHIRRITCPIGDPNLGKHPQAIAIGVAAKLLEGNHKISKQKEQTA